MISLDMWQNLVRMGGHYARFGFRDSPQPWTASSQAIHVTLPSDRTSCQMGGQTLVGSAEQAFIDRMLTKQLPKGKWQSITPCFRNEDTYDNLHQPYFVKLELIHYMPEIAEIDLETMIVQARWAFMTLIPKSGPDVLIEKTDIGWDLTLHGQEIGSYGIREHAGHQWVYGTGIAEPRFTTLKNRLDF